MAYTTLKGIGLVQAMSGESVIIYVGPERKRYLIHKDLLTKQSGFFEKAFKGNFREAEENSICLEEESPAAFDILVGWLYQGHIPTVGPPFGGFKTAEIDAPLDNPLVPGAILQLESTDGTRYRRLLGPSQTDIRMTLGSQPQPPKNGGTGQIAYNPHSEPSVGYPYGTVQGLSLTDVFKPISAQKEYRKWSPEELRAADYSERRRWNSRLSVQILSDINETDDLLNGGNSDSDNIYAAASFTQFYNGHLPGIPRSGPLSILTAAEESHQVALLNLCLLAESLCWTSLFNPAMSAYMLGEATLSTRRPLPGPHIALIYTRTYASSPCRRFAADSAVSHLPEPEAQWLYAKSCHDHPAFLDDLLASAGRNPALGLRDPTRRGACPYHRHDEDAGAHRPPGRKCETDCLADELMKEHECGLFGKVEERLTALGRRNHARAWMDWKDMVAMLGHWA